MFLAYGQFILFCFIKVIKQGGAAFENNRLHFVFLENDVSSVLKVQHVIHRCLINSVSVTIPDAV